MTGIENTCPPPRPFKRKRSLAVTAPVEAEPSVPTQLPMPIKKRVVFRPLPSVELTVAAADLKSPTACTLLAVPEAVKPSVDLNQSRDDSERLVTGPVKVVTAPFEAPKRKKLPPVPATTKKGKKRDRPIDDLLALSGMVVLPKTDRVMDNHIMSILNSSATAISVEPAEVKKRGPKASKEPAASMAPEDAKDKAKVTKRAKMTDAKNATSLNGVKKTKGLRGVLRARQPLTVSGVSPIFETPPPLPVNEYWVYLPVPQKKLFRALLSMDPLSEPPVQAEEVPSMPEPSTEALRTVENFDSHYEALQRQLAEQVHELSAAEKVGQCDELRATCTELRERMLALEIENQSKAFEYSKQVYYWVIDKERLEQPAKDHLKAENDRKTGVMANVQHHLNAHRKHINNIQKAVLEVELGKAISSVSESVGATVPPLDEAGGGEAVQVPVPEVTESMTIDHKEKITLLKRRIAQTLEAVGVSSKVKLDIFNTSSAISKAIKPLKAHLLPKKGKYNKTGAFTKEKRAEKVSTARPYNKSGKHINDFQKPRFPKQRDEQIVERAKLLGVSVEDFKQSVMGN